MSGQRHGVAEAYKALDIVLDLPRNRNGWNRRERKRLLAALDVLDAAATS